MTAAACATRLASPTRSRRAVMTSESVVGIRWALTSSPSANRARSSSRKRGTPSARRTSARAHRPAARPSRAVARASCGLRRCSIGPSRSSASACTCGSSAISGRALITTRTGVAPRAMHVHRFQRARVGPMRVLDHEKERARRLPFIDPRGRLLWRRGDPTHDLTERLQRTQGPPPAAHQGHDPLPPRLELRAELEQQTGLADPGLSGDHHHPARPVPELGPLLVEPARRRGPGDELRQRPRLQAGAGAAALARRGRPARDARCPSA